MSKRQPKFGGNFRPRDRNAGVSYAKALVGGGFNTQNSRKYNRPLFNNRDMRQVVGI